jgi:hypothetical protein
MDGEGSGESSWIDLQLADKPIVFNRLEQVFKDRRFLVSLGKLGWYFRVFWGSFLTTQSC